MGNYAPNFFPAFRRTYTAGATITGGQLVQITAASTVSPATATGQPWVGVAEYDAASGAQVTVLQCVGEHLMTASGSIAAGAYVVPAAAGAVATIGSDTNYNDVVGIAITAATNGQTVPVLFR
jgi:hypothetical protein